MFQQVQHAGAVSQTQHVANIFRADRCILIAALDNGLVQQRQRIAHGAFSSARDQGQAITVDGGMFQAANTIEMVGQDFAINPLEIKTLTARQYRDRHLANLGCREDEFGVRRRLFQRLQKRVEGGGRQHVDLIDDIDLVATGHRCIPDTFKDFPDIAHTSA